jgi:hypothetical protein
VNYLKLSFDDSTIRAAQVVLNDGDLSAEGQYEVEWDVLHRPVFTWDGGAGGVDIPPGGRYTVSVNCLGKVGWYVSAFLANIQTQPDLVRMVLSVLITAISTMTPSHPSTPAN